MHGYDGGDWVWMTVGTGLWSILTVVVVDAAVVLASRRRDGSDR